MVPARVAVVERLPKTGTGKIDYPALPEICAAAAEPPAHAPLTPLELRIAELWSDLLGAEARAPDDDFFALGGTSLQVMALMSRIRREFGVELDVKAVVERPTLAGLAHLIRGGPSEDHPRCVVAVQSAGLRPPFFMASLGHTWEVGALSRLLGPEQPVYRLQPSGPTEERAREAGVHGVAAHYVCEMRRARPRGPYILGGGCAAGIVALEMARQLAECGEAVPLLALFDTPFPARRVLPYGLGIFLLRLRRTLRRVRRLQSREQFSYAARRGRFWCRRAVHLISGGRCGRGGAEPHCRYARAVRHELDSLSEPARRAVWRHTGAAYSGRVVLFETGRPDGDALRDRRTQWRQLLHGEVEVRGIPGEHNHALEEPHVRAVAATLSEFITASLGDLEATRP
jgi:thioesterase domain-containing protein/aryl carrier-like protein